MEGKPELRIGSLLVTRDLTRRFMLQDAHDHDLREMTLDDVDVPELIKFLHQWSAASQRHLRLDFVPEAQAPHLPNPAVSAAGRVAEVERSEPPECVP